MNGPKQDQWDRLPVSDEVLAKERAESIENFKAHTGHVIDKFTCDDCGARRTCTLVFDPYNTNGDCLMEK